MALSEDEQRLLQQMEQALAADDPKLASALRGTAARRVYGRRALIAALGLLAGLAALVAGMQVSPIVSVLGFLIMLASTVAGLTSWQQVGADTVRVAQPRPRATSDTGFFNKFDDRRRRPDDVA